MNTKAPSSLEEGVGGGGRTVQHASGTPTEQRLKTGKPTRQTLLKRAAEMRQNPTEPERRLWTELRNSRLAGIKFRRQAVIGTRIADFFCPAKSLIIEIDGHTHDQLSDRAKDNWTERELGFQTIRFTNDDIMQNMDGVLERLIAVLDKQADRWPGGRAHYPQTPSCEEEGA